MGPAEALAWLDAHVNLETGLGSPPSSPPSSPPPGSSSGPGGAPPDRAPAPGARRGAPTLERIRSLTDLLGSPQSAYPSVHVTGTNGKTSVVRITAALLGAVGLDVGSFTSPHLERVEERLVRAGEPVTAEDLADLLTRIRIVETALADPPSWFEILTAAALEWFADVGVDVAVVEVGLGGTWDATAVVESTVAVVTNVAIDHVEYLGPTRESIATDKAGIVGPADTLVLGETDPALAGIFLDRRPAAVLRRGADFGVREQRLAHRGRLVHLFTPGGDYPDLHLPLHGAHQADNAAVALAAAEAFLGRALPPDVVAEALAGVTSPGRLEVVGHQPMVLLDGAHNVAGAEALAAARREEFPDSPCTLVVGLLREKDPREMLAALGAPAAARVVACRPPSPRALDPSVVAAAAVALGVPADAVEVIDDPADALAHARAVTRADGQIVVTGSLYVVGAARSSLRVASP